MHKSDVVDNALQYYTHRDDRDVHRQESDMSPFSSLHDGIEAMDDVSSDEATSSLTKRTGIHL